VTEVIKPGDADAVSFNDDSSPDTRQTAREKVVINAQVFPGTSLDWYYRVLQLCASIPGELKSADVWLRFRTLNGENKDRIWAGLSKVRIHIIDPRPYRKSFNNIVKKMLACDDPATFLQRQRAANDPRAIWLSVRSQVFTAERILNDSVGVRVHNVSKFLSGGLFHVAGTRDAEDQVLDLSEFGNEAKPLVGTVSAWAAKSAATFHEALDCFVNVDPETRFFSDDIIKKRMRARVLDTHAFDKGHQTHIELLESARDNILTNLSEPTLDGRGEANPAAKPYLETDSKASYFVQAGDIAAGVASKLLETENLVAVVTSFEYVTYNGNRLSVSDAEEVLRLARY